MTLRPYVKAHLEVAQTVDISDIEKLKKERDRFQQKEWNGFNYPFKKIEDLSIHNKTDTLIRVYTPNIEGPYNLFVFFHGGGFVKGGLDSHDIICRKLAYRGGVKVISVDYRLAPEHPFPIAPEDCYFVTKWVSEHLEMLNGEGKQIFIGGDSAGGNLAAVVSQMCRDRKEPYIAKQILIYPVTDYHSLEHDSIYSSYHENAKGYGLTNKEMALFWNYYIRKDESKFHPYASPIRAEDLSDLPDALVITAQYDVLRDEGVAYAEKLFQAGNFVQHRQISGTIHGFLSSFSEEEETEEVYKLIISFLGN
ncbi:alpha/beta hydrolase [Alkalihalobacillus sp. TS-13]|uniref:alpha/beta hydrolase n=1 Tax=Alkalihalobacillus sp. TS-13 TaxID=2842455 RepID=UPI001C87B9AD|nr:alpha/beta hydrolase [Alkalihalobacillus sp. TS-13]